MTPDQRFRVWVVVIICGTVLLVCAGCLVFTAYVNTIYPTPTATP